MGNKKIDVDSSAIMKAGNLLADAENYVASAQKKISGMGIRTISGPGMSSAGIMCNMKETITNILGIESNLLSKISSDLKSNAKELGAFDEKTNKIKGFEDAKSDDKKHAKKSGGNNGSVSSAVAGAFVSEQTNKKKKKKKKNKKNKKKKKKKVIGVLKNNVPNMLPLTSVTTIAPASSLLVQVNPMVEPAPSPHNEALTSLETGLKNGDIKSAKDSYEFLKSINQEDAAKQILEKNGYKIDEQSGDIVKNEVSETQSIKEETNTDSTTSTTNNSTETEVVASEAKEEVKAQEYSGEIKVVENSNNSNNNTQSIPRNENNTNVSSNETSSNNSAPINTEPNVSTQQTETPSVSSQPSNQATSEKPSTTTTPSAKPSVVTITDDTPSSSKSSNFGTVAAVGLGTVAVGAAAVAGVRYVKNRHEENEDYGDESESEEFKSDNNYVDSAEYETESNYTDDNYLGPQGSNYEDVEVEDVYVDPDELGEEYNDSGEDLVLEDLESNY